MVFEFIFGPAANQKQIFMNELTEYISWVHQDKSGFIYEEKQTQEVNWEKEWNSTDLVRADIIVCGFDVLYCLIFAPFNKKIIINSAYRFEGHISPSLLCNDDSYNLDVIMSGAIIYDVLHHFLQHFLSAHKMIQLPESCDYVRELVKKKIATNECKGVPADSTGYHSSGEVLIMPKRLSRDGFIVADSAGKTKKICNQVIQECYEKAA